MQITQERIEAALKQQGWARQPLDGGGCRYVKAGRDPVFPGELLRRGDAHIQSFFDEDQRIDKKAREEAVTREHEVIVVTDIPPTFTQLLDLFCHRVVDSRFVMKLKGVKGDPEKNLLMLVLGEKPEGLDQVFHQLKLGYNDAQMIELERLDV